MKNKKKKKILKMKNLSHLFFIYKKKSNFISIKNDISMNLTGRNVIQILIKMEISIPIHVYCKIIYSIRVKKD